MKATTSRPDRLLLVGWWKMSLRRARSWPWMWGGIIGGCPEGRKGVPVAEDAAAAGSCGGETPRRPTRPWEADPSDHAKPLGSVTIWPRSNDGDVVLDRNGPRGAPR